LAVALLTPFTTLAVAERPIIPSGPGPQRAVVDPDLLVASADGSLADLRLRDAQGKEVPYVLVPPPASEGTWQPARFIKERPSKTSSGFVVDFGKPTAVARMRLVGLPAPFLKRCQVIAGQDGIHWLFMVPEGTLFDLPDKQLQLLELDLIKGEYRYVRFTWDDRNSGRLPDPKAVEFYTPPKNPTPPPVLAPLRFTRRPSEPGVSRFRVEVPPHLPVRALVLQASGKYLFRKARVTEPELQDGQLVPAELGTGLIRRVTQGALQAWDQRIPIKPPSESAIELTVEDGDNGPLDLVSVAGELEQLPWIYFESPDGGKVTATVGDRRLRKPHYDVEAVQAELPNIQTGEALWGALKPVPAPADAVLLPDPGPGASIDPAPFKRVRAIPDLALPGLASAQLDADVLARSPQLADLRIVNKAGKQVPYILERRDEPLAIDLPLPKPTLDKGVSTYAVELPEAGLPASRLVLETTARVFQRRVTLVEESAGAGDRGQHRLDEASWRHANPDQDPPSVGLSLPSLRGRKILIRVDEGDNSPLPLASLRLLLPSYRLRFFHPGAGLTLLLENPQAQAPRYDLTLLAPRLHGAPAKELELGAVLSSAGISPPLTESKVFWGVLVVAVVVLLAMLGRMLKKMPPEAKPQG
jgi:hypothetical protein